MEEIESKISGDVQKVVDDFDLNYERLLKFGKTDYHGDSIKKYLDSLIEKGTLKGWDEIAVTCRRMIICDRELDLEEGTGLMEKTRKRFEELKREMFEGGHTKNYNNDQLLYEAIRYANTCGLISYRCADYSSALEYFEDAAKMAEDNPSMHAFAPDLTSNAIRTDFEFFRHTLPEKIKSEDVHYYEGEFERFIEQFNGALNAHKDEWHKYQTDKTKRDKIKRNIYGHGMASLYHNLGDCYHIQYEKFRELNELIANEALKNTEKCHGRSLSWGEKVEDIYRQLQSKRYLSDLVTDEEERDRLEQEVLDGNWVRGKQIVYQHQIKRSEDSEEINNIIANLRLDKNDKDKIGVLYNYDAIKNALKRSVKGLVKKLFIWDNIPGIDNEELIRFLIDDFDIDWVKNAKIRKSADSKIIQIFKDENSAKITIVDKKKAILEIRDGRTCDLEVKDENGKLNIHEELTLLGIANKKIDVVENMRKKEFYLLYRRQAIHLIQDDVLEIIDDFWDKENWKEVTNWSEHYSCRDLIELARISLTEGLEPTSEQRNKIKECKKAILNVDREEINKHAMSNFNIPLALTLDEKTHDKSWKLTHAYESVLKKPSKDFDWKKWDAHEVLIGLLKKIHNVENTAAVLKFLIFEQAGQKKKVGRALLIKKEGIKKVLEFDLDFVNEAKDAIVGIERVTGKISNIWRFIQGMDRDYVEEINKIVYKGRIWAYDETVVSYRNKISAYEIVRSYENMILSYKKSLYNTLEDLSKVLKLDEELKDVKNLFIIPDGELFQLPLHLMFKDIQDLNVYYSPTLTHLLTPSDSDTSKNNKAANYLWVLCPTDDLCPGGKPILKHPEYNKIKLCPLKCENATLKSLPKEYKSNNITHIGFSTHGLFHDHSKDAYVSQILFNDSFLTPYDIIFYCNFSGIQTIFLGCCKVGSSKYTDENEAIGLVTAFLSKKAVSVIAPLWTIDNITHDAFIDAVNKSGVADRPKAWNLADILGKFENPYEAIPFVQYANIDIVVGRLPEQKEILSYLQENDPFPYNQKAIV